MYKKIMLILFSVSISTLMCAQRVSISTDVFKLATLSPNISFDISLSSKLSLNMEGIFNPFDQISKNFSLKRISVSPELRYWFKRPLHSHYFGINILASIYDLKISRNRSKGQTIALGLGYGYSFILTKRVSLTPAIGIGYGYVFSHTSPELNEQSPIKRSFKPVLTRMGVTFSYIIN